MRNWRLNVVLAFIIIFGAAIVSRLFFIQILNHKLYQAQALGQQAGFSEIQGQRGEVYSQNSQESKGAYGTGDIKSLAINKEKWAVSVIPQKVKDKNIIAESLGKAIGESKEFVLSKIENSDFYTVIKKDLSSDAVGEVKKIKLDGIHLENIGGRYYPQEEMAATITGFLGGDGTGQYGVEGYYEDVLKGQSGIKEEKKGIDIADSSNTGLELNGSDIYLTIDYNIQFQAESLLKEAQQKLNIDSGQIVVLKPDTGRILAIANFTSFDPNYYSKEKNLDIFQNSAIQKIFEPGSIMKPFTMAMGINEGKITPQTIFVDTGSVKLGKDVIHNFDRKTWGKQTMTGVLENSINTGAVFVSQLMSHQTFLDYLDKFGFNEKTGVELQGEVTSKNNINGPDVEFATASFGQGIGVTPIQIARGFCAIANGGKLVNLYVVDKIVKGDKEINTTPQISNDQIISQQTASQVTTMLTSVVERGFGKGAKIPGYYLAGKTGTAQVPFENKNGYYPDKTIQTFIGFGPALNPQFLILVKLDNPKVSVSSLSTVPVFKKLAQYIINYWQIPPDYDINNKK
ncbi:MAG: penicillin-binding protein 2 [Candidatus Staskawiczbacteria bacterium]|nr:penicillin-binding protein 2 [Candidatus Staskawiczbacteria bacterium]